MLNRAAVFMSNKKNWNRLKYTIQNNPKKDSASLPAATEALIIALHV